MVRVYYGMYVCSCMCSPFGFRARGTKMKIAHFVYTRGFIWQKWRESMTRKQGDRNFNYTTNQIHTTSNERCLSNTNGDDIVKEVLFIFPKEHTLFGSFERLV